MCFGMQGLSTHRASWSAFPRGRWLRAGRGAVVYMEHANGGADLIQKAALQARPERGLSIPPMSFRERLWHEAPRFLSRLEAAQTENPLPFQQHPQGRRTSDGYGLEIVEQLPV